VVPTLNLKTAQELLPKLGVYATETFLRGKTYKSATNVGMRPTFEGKKITIETHVLDFDENLTDGPMEVRFLTRLRDERKFPGAEALREQILEDVQNARKFFEMSSKAEANK
jgi:riboflavin kinase/FMN adenylyltransferase